MSSIEEKNNDNESSTLNSSLERIAAPVTILSGFLGSGKTTLLNYIMQCAPNKKIAVIENEFGEEIGIENLIVDASTGQVFEEVFELGNGCVCCSMKGELQRVLDNILERKEKFDHIIVETTGLANPGPVAAEFWVDEEELESKYYLDAIVTVVDAKHLIQHLDDKNISADNVNEAERQLAFADRIILNKRDLIDDDAQLEEIKRRIREINSYAPILVSERSRVPLEQIIGIRAFSAKRVGDLQQQPENSLPHSKGVRTVSFVEATPFELSKFENWLGTLLWEEEEEEEEAEAEAENDDENNNNDDNNNDDCCDENNDDNNNNSVDIISNASKPKREFFRIKGVLNVKDDSNRYVVQAVHELFDVSTSGQWPENETRLTRLVFIGRGLDRTQLIKSFKKNVLEQ